MSRDRTDASRRRQRSSSNRGRRRKQKSRLGKVLTIVAIVASLSISAVAVGGYLYYLHLNGNLNQSDLSLGGQDMEKSKADADGNRPLNILLIGSDSRNSEANQKLGGAKGEAGRPPLADVQMLLHLSADRSNASMISVPRDTQVNVPECRDKENDKRYPATQTSINTSLQHGGPGCTVATWYKLTKIPIDHFMMIDFAGVVQMADAIGGVPVCVKDNVRDPHGSHLRLTKGKHTIKGEDALKWLRTRHAFEDGSDIGRTHAQHQYMNAMLRKLKSNDTLTSPDKLTSLAESATEALTVDHGIGSVKKLYGLGQELRKIDLPRMTMLTMPWTPAPQNPAKIEPKPQEADQLFSMIRNDIPLDKHGNPKKKHSDTKKKSPSASAAPKSDIPVTVQNGSPTTGRADQLSGKLRQLGFNKTSNGMNAPARQESSTLTYPKGDKQAKANAARVAKSLHMPISTLKASSDSKGVRLVIGTDWPKGSNYRKTMPKQGSVPDSADASNPSEGGSCMEVNKKGGYSF